MARPKRETLVVRQLVGMNTADPPINLLPGQAQILENVDLIDGGLGVRRRGFVTTPAAGSPPSGMVNSRIHALHRHVPTGEDASAELWAVRRTVDGATTTVHRYAGGTWSLVALPDAPSTTQSGNVWSFATFNQKLFIAYDSGVNRLHVWDGVSIRRVGVAPPAAIPVIFDLGPGALSFTRFYRVRFTAAPGVPTTVLFSEPGPSATITVAASAGVRVARPALVDGNETGWFVEAATTANGPWFVIGQLAVGTLTFDDTNATIPTTNPAREAGLFTLPPSAKYLSVYQNQLIMAGAWETTAIAGQTIPKNNRVWFTRPLGTFDISDDEAIPNTIDFKFWVDVGEDDDRVTGLSYPLEGIPYVTKLRQFWSLIPRDDPSAPFAAVRLTDAVGCRDHRTLVIGEDDAGNPTLYFNSLRGPFRMGRRGLQYLGRDLYGDFFLSNTDIMLWVAELQQVWCLTTGTNQIHKFHVRYGVATGGEVRNGWTRDLLEGSSPNVWSATLFAQDFSVTNPVQQPVVGGILPGFNDTFLWSRRPSTNTDVGDPYQGRVKLAAYPLGEFLYNVVVYPPRVYAQPSPVTIGTTTLLVTVTRNFQIPSTDTPQTDLTTLPVALTARQFIGTFEGIGWSDAEVYEFELSDNGFVDQTWRLMAFVVPWQVAEEAE